MSPRHSASLLILVLLCQLLLLIAQLPGEGAGDTRLERWVLRVVSPVAHAVSAVEKLAGDLRKGARTRKHLKRENERLRWEVESLKGSLLVQQNAENDLTRLQDAVRYVRANSGLRFVVGDVVFSDHRSWLRSLVLYVGEERDAVGQNQPVVTTSGLVGRVISVTGPYAKVQLLTDRASAVGAMLERTRRQGVVRGVEAGLLEMDYVPRQEQVEVGDRVVTAGIDGVYPRGIAIGKVVQVEEGSDLFHRIVVTPSVEMDALDHAYLLLGEGVPEEVREAGHP